MILCNKKTDLKSNAKGCNNKVKMPESNDWPGFKWQRSLGQIVYLKTTHLESIPKIPPTFRLAQGERDFGTLNCGF
jgi:hypothetical protein